jgi:ABC-type spermidine/putrescine transport system permease subunit II
MTTASSASASDPACRRFFYGWVILAACFMVTTVASGTMMGFGVHHTNGRRHGLVTQCLSFSYALSALVTGIGVLIVGSFLHTHSVRFIFFLSTIVHCVGIYMTSTATTIEAFYFGTGSSLL